MDPSEPARAVTYVLRTSYLSEHFTTVDQARAGIAVEQVTAGGSLRSGRNQAVNVDIVEVRRSEAGSATVTVVESVVFVVPPAALPGP